jgi:hypothetical protein
MSDGFAGGRGPGPAGGVAGGDGGVDGAGDGGAEGAGAGSFAIYVANLSTTKASTRSPAPMASQSIWTLTRSAFTRVILTFKS